METVETLYICKTCTSTFFKTPEGNCTNCGDNAWITKQDKRIHPNTLFILTGTGGSSGMDYSDKKNPKHVYWGNDGKLIPFPSQVARPKKSFWKKALDFLFAVTIGIVFGPTYILIKKK